MSTDEIIARFQREYQEYHRISLPRAKQQRALILNFSSSVSENLGGAQSSDLQSFAGALLAEGYHVNTVRKKLNMLKPFFGWAYAAGLITGDQYMGLKAVKNPRGSTGSTKPDPYSRPEIKTFWAALDSAFPKCPAQGRRSQAIKRWREGKGPWGRVWKHAMRLQIDAMVRLALDLGLRANEIFELKVNDLHYDNDYIVIRGKADPNTGEVKIRHVPFTTDCRQAVYTWLEFRATMHPGHDITWLSCWADTRTNPMWKTRFSTLLQDTVGEGWRWHRFRHTCGTEWLRSGMPLEKVSKLLGHATLQQTLCYAEIAKGDLATAVARHEESFGKAVAA